MRISSTTSTAALPVVPLTTTIIDAPLFRITLDPSRQNGLNRVSQIMVDKVLTLPREKIGKRVGIWAIQS